jgi:hypothetical protein
MSGEVVKVDNRSIIQPEKAVRKAVNRRMDSFGKKWKKGRKRKKLPGNRQVFR